MEHRGVNPARCDGVDADAFGRELCHEGTLQTQDGCLGRGVGYNLFHTHQGRHGTDEDDAALAAFDHQFGKLATQGEDAHHVDVEHVEELLVRDVQRPFLEVYAGAVDEDVNGSNLLYQSGNLVNLRYVEGPVAALLAQLLLGLAQFLFVSSNDDYFGSGLYKHLGNAKT